MQVVSCLELGGTEAFIMNNYRALDKTQYQFDFLVFIEKEYPYISEIESLGGHVFFSGLPSVFHIKQFEDSVEKTVREHGPYDAVHCHVNIQNGFPLKAAQKCGIPIRISHSHASLGKEGKGIRKLLTKYKEHLIKKYATHMLACSSAAGTYLYGKSYFDLHGKVIPNGIDVNSFLAADKKQTEDLRNEFEIPSDCEMVVGNITRFDLNKNPMFTVRVFDAILKQVPTAILLMGGPDGGQLDAVKTLVKDLGIENHVRFIGKRTDIPACLQLIDVYVFPSLSEGLGIALLEAQAAGCLCYASNTVLSDSNMNIGNVHYYDLKDSPKLWAERIVSQFVNWEKPTPEKVKSAFQNAGYDILTSHRRLLEVYEGAK